MREGHGQGDGPDADESRESSEPASVARAPVAGPPSTLTAPQAIVPTVDAWVDADDSSEPGEPRREPFASTSTSVLGASAPSFAELEVEARRGWAALRDHAREPSPPSSPAPVDQFVWGLAQPALGVRLLLRHGDLFVRGVIPAALFIGLCALWVDQTDGGVWATIVAYYGVLVGAASFSPILFTRNYAKLAAEARRHLDVPEHQPYLRSYKQAIAEAIAQAIVLGVGVAPWLALIGELPLFGGIWAAVLGWVWVLHWIVVEALDSARTLAPGETPELAEQRSAELDPPWFSGAMLAKLRAPLPVLLLPLRLWGGLLARLGRRWRGEVALIEARPFLAVGFGLGASLLLLVPVLNLLLRPALVIAASHVLGRIEPELEPEPEPEPEPAGMEGDDGPRALPEAAASASAPTELG